MSGGGTVRVLGIAGSLRRGSFNAATLRTAQELAPAGMTIESFDIAPIPLYNEDVRQQGFPAPVEDLRARIKAADGLLLVTPEYNYSIPGVLKNAIDWASRPPNHLRQTCVYLDMLPLNKPEVFVSAAHQKVDAEGRLSDEPARAAIRALLEALAAWARRLGRAG